MPVYKKLHIDFQLLGYFLNVLHIEFYGRVPKIVFPVLKFQSYKQDKCPKGPLTCILYSEQYFFMPVIFRWRANTGTYFVQSIFLQIRFLVFRNLRSTIQIICFSCTSFLFLLAYIPGLLFVYHRHFYPYIYIMYCTEQIHRVLTYFVNSYFFEFEVVIKSICIEIQYFYRIQTHKLL